MNKANSNASNAKNPVEMLDANVGLVEVPVVVKSWLPTSEYKPLIRS